MNQIDKAKMKSIQIDIVLNKNETKASSVLLHIQFKLRKKVNKIELPNNGTFLHFTG